MRFLESALREYTTWVVVGSCMPRLNRVFEELGVKYEDHEVPEKLRRTTAAKVDSSKVEAKKRKVVSQHPL